MITVTAQFSIIPGKEAEAETAIRKVAAGVEKNEPGVLMYTWHRGAKDPLQILVYEIYQDDEAREAHRGTPYLTEFQAHFGTVFDPASVKIARWERLTGINR